MVVRYLAIEDDCKELHGGRLVSMLKVLYLFVYPKLLELQFSLFCKHCHYLCLHGQSTVFIPNITRMQILTEFYYFYLELI